MKKLSYLSRGLIAGVIGYLVGFLVFKLALVEMGVSVQDIASNIGALEDLEDIEVTIEGVSSFIWFMFAYTDPLGLFNGGADFSKALDTAEELEKTLEEIDEFGEQLDDELTGIADDLLE